MSLLKTLILSLAVLTFSFVGTVVLHRALAFNNPSAPPPAGNVPLPLNTSPTTQTKQGPIGATQFQDTDNTNYFFKPAGLSKLGGTLDLSNNLIKNVPDPVDPQDVATKAYVDANTCDFTGTALPSDVKSGKTFYSTSCVKQTGTAQLGVGNHITRIDYKSATWRCRGTPYGWAWQSGSSLRTLQVKISNSSDLLVVGGSVPGIYIPWGTNQPTMNVYVDDNYVGTASYAWENGQQVLYTATGLSSGWHSIKGYLPSDQGYGWCALAAGVYR